MNTTLPLLALGGLILAASCSAVHSQRASGALDTNSISVVLWTNADNTGVHTTWTFNGAWRQTAYTNEVVEWHFPYSFFLYIDESKSHINWDKCKDPVGNQADWKLGKDLDYPFKQDKHRALFAKYNSATSNYVVSLVFPIESVQDNGFPVIYRLVTYMEDPKGGPRIRALSYDYYMAEALLDWGDVLRGAHRK